MNNKKLCYIGYYDGLPLCTSSKLTAVKSYLRDNRRLSPDQYDIIYADRKFKRIESDIELIEYFGRYVTVKESHIILRDFYAFMDDAYTTYNNLSDMIKLTRSSERKAIRTVIGIYEDLFDPDEDVSDPSQRDMLRKFFMNHELLEMDMPTYLARLAAFPNYFMV